MGMWYNQYIQKKMYEKFLSLRLETFEEVKSLLEGDDFEEFSLACLYLESLSYKGSKHIGESGM